MPHAPGMVVVDEAELARLPGIGRDVPGRAGAGARRHGRHPPARPSWRSTGPPPTDHLTRAGASALSGLASWGGGDLEAAHRAYSDCVEGLQRAGHIADVLGCSITLADIRITQGRLGDALRTYERALAARRPADPGPCCAERRTCTSGMSQIACERGDLARPPSTCA